MEVSIGAVTASGERCFFSPSSCVSSTGGGSPADGVSDPLDEEDGSSSFSLSGCCYK